MSTSNNDAKAIFPRGEQITNENFTGTVWLHMLVNDPEDYNTVMGSVTFEPGARTNWHTHPGGQILLVTQGTGWYQEKGRPIQTITKGDVIKIAPDLVHWHGATPDNTMTHIALSPNAQKGGTDWLEPVTDKEYSK